MVSACRAALVSCLLAVVLAFGPLPVHGFTCLDKTDDDGPDWRPHEPPSGSGSGSSGGSGDEVDGDPHARPPPDAGFGEPENATEAQLTPSKLDNSSSSSSSSSSGSDEDLSGDSGSQEDLMHKKHKPKPVSCWMTVNDTHDPIVLDAAACAADLLGEKARRYDYGMVEVVNGTYKLSSSVRFDFWLRVCEVATGITLQPTPDELCKPDTYELLFASIEYKPYGKGPACSWVSKGGDGKGKDPRTRDNKDKGSDGPDRHVYPYDFRDPQDADPAPNTNGGPSDSDNQLALVLAVCLTSVAIIIAAAVYIGFKARTIRVALQHQSPRVLVLQDISSRVEEDV